MPGLEIEHAYYKFYTFVRPERLAAGWTRERIASEIQSRGVPCFSGSCSEVYRERAFPEEWRPRHGHPIARELGETSLMLQVHPTISAELITTATRIVRDVMASATIAKNQSPRSIQRREVVSAASV